MGDVDAWYARFEADLEYERALSLDVLNERKGRVEMELKRIKEGSLPPTRIFDAIRAHVIMALAAGEKELIIDSLQQTVDSHKTTTNYLLLWAAHRSCGEDDRAELIRDKVGLPQ